ncbi:MAG: DsbA family protein [Alphaproteobacteria bacterium]
MRNILIVQGGIAVLAVAALGIYQWQGGIGPAGTPSSSGGPTANATAEEIARAKGIQADDLSIGKADAPVTVIEYASLTCPHCADFHVNVLPKIKAEYIDTGKIRMAFRDFPLDRGALAATIIARCAGSERRLGMLDLFFTRQQAWAGSNDPMAALAQIAGLAGMAEADVKACFDKEDIEKAVLDQRLLSEKVFNIDATPSFVINGTKYSGGMTFDEFKAVVDPLIAKSAKPAQ